MACQVIASQPVQFIDDEQQAMMKTPPNSPSSSLPPDDVVRLILNHHQQQRQQQVTHFNGEDDEHQELTTIDEDDEELSSSANANTSHRDDDTDDDFFGKTKRHLERRLWRRIVWGSAVSAINLGGALASLGVPNAHHRVLRRLMQVAGGLSRLSPQRTGLAATSKELIDRVHCRIYRPISEAGAASDEMEEIKTKLPVIVYLHGGGWSIGSARVYHPFTQRLCRDTGAVIVSVDYRLAPENAYPIPLDDCLAATRALLDGQRNPTAIGSLAGEIDVNRVVLAGDSAGGNLSGAVALELIRSADAALPRLKGVLMICPVTQAITAMHESHLKYAPRYSSGSLGYFVSLYAGVPPTKNVLDAIKNDQHLPLEQRNRWLKYVMPRIAETPEQQTVSEDDDTTRTSSPRNSRSSDCDTTSANNQSPSVIPDKIVQLATTVRAWPLLAEDEHLAQFPPCMIQTADHDVLMSENVVFIERMRRSGAVDVRHSHIERSEHCETILSSLLIGSKASRQGYQEIVDFLKEQLQDVAGRTPINSNNNSRKSSLQQQQALEEETIIIEQVIDDEKEQEQLVCES